MTEYFRIEGKNLIDFDRQMVTGTAPIYCLSQGRPPTDLGKPLTRGEILAQLSRLPLGIRGHALNRGMSMVTFPFDIQADTDPEMEQALHGLKRTLNEAELYIESESARGTRAVLHYKSDNAVQHSYKTIYYGYLAEAGARDVLGARAKESYLANLQLTLYMEPKWRPAMAITLGPNEIYCPGLEEDGNADGLADNWVLLNAPAATMESTIVLQGFYSQKLITGAFVGRGIQSATFVAPAGTTAAVCYAWLCRPAAGSNIIVELYDVTTPAVVASALYDTAGWKTETAKDGVSIFKQVVVSSAAGIVAGRTYRLRIYNTVDTGAIYYVDKAYWKWGTVTAPDEWCDHWLIYNHYDTTESAAHVGHQNYFDVADLKGTDEARLLLRVKFEQMADENRAKTILCGRRTRPDLFGFMWWMEAEDRTGATNWATAALARCSAGNRVSNAGASTGGYVYWNVDAVYGNMAAHLGDYDVFGVVYTTDPVNTMYRLYYSMGAPMYNHWVKQTLTNKWELIFLGSIYADPFVRTGMAPYRLAIYVEYLKDNGDTAELDLICLVPKDEPETRLDQLPGMSISVDDYWVSGQDEDFDYIAIEQDIPLPEYVLPAALRGDFMMLVPDKENRMYFTGTTWDSPDDIWEAHGAANPLRWLVSAAYLPQYQTPLD